jgi:hypothetical protein
MSMTSVLCRTQETLQRERAAATSLDNVRAQAIRAAAAWGREALLAERMEQNRLASRSLANRGVPRPDNQPDLQSFSENPDRGYAAP